MEIYLSSRKCPKCGGGEAVDKYHDGLSYACISLRSFFEKCPGSGWGEHISRYCRRCGFCWAEACIDAALVSKPEE